MQVRPREASDPRERRQRSSSASERLRATTKKRERTNNTTAKRNENAAVNAWLKHTKTTNEKPFHSEGAQTSATRGQRERDGSTKPLASPRAVVTKPQAAPSHRDARLLQLADELVTNDWRSDFALRCRGTPTVLDGRMTM